MGITEKVAITVAVIGLTGTLGAALINSGALKRATPADAVQNQADDPPPEKTAATVEDRTQFAPHADEIRVGAQTQVWGKQTRQISLAPGQKIEIDARGLYTEATTFPQSSCLGPGYIIYTWQVRKPYPEGGDLEIRGVIPQSGGNTEQLAMGAKGRGRMDPCNIHVFINRGLDPMELELQYATAADEDAMAEYYNSEAEKQ